MQYIALRAGVFSRPSPPPQVIEHLFSAVVIMAIFTTLITPPLLEAISVHAGRQIEGDEYCPKIVDWWVQASRVLRIVFLQNCSLREERRIFNRLLSPFIPDQGKVHTTMSYILEMMAY